MTTLKITRREMTQDDRYVYTKARAARILGLKESQIEFVYVCDDGRILIGLFCDSVYMDKLTFNVHYAEERKERSNGLKVTKRLDESHSYSVRNDQSKSIYKVSCYSNHLSCNCADNEISRQIFKTNQVACKHIYSVLNILGFNSLSEYVHNNNEMKKFS